nr:MAG TPA: hypothetical protein [Caudoviricetes sp.]
MFDKSIDILQVSCKKLLTYKETCNNIRISTRNL